MQAANVLDCTGTNPANADTVRHGSNVLSMTEPTKNRSIMTTASASVSMASAESSRDTQD